MRHGVLHLSRQAGAHRWRPRRCCALVLAVSTAVIAFPAYGAELTPASVTRLTPAAPPEQYGPIFPILEEDMRTTIQQRFEAKIPELKQQLTDSVRNYRLPTIPRPTTATARTLLVDPSLTLQNDVVAPDGRLIAKAGTRVNPLRTIALVRTYLVVDASDDRQMVWAVQQIMAGATRPTTLLLTDGDLAAVMAAVPAGTPVYPAPPELFTRFPVDSVPARLSRAGDQLRIDFIPEQDLK
jgi:conjugal transfer pilus assembly protein TraW